MLKNSKSLKTIYRKSIQNVLSEHEARNTEIDSKLDMSFGQQRREVCRTMKISKPIQVKKSLYCQSTELQSPKNVVQQKYKKLKQLKQASDEIYKKLDDIRNNKFKFYQQAQRYRTPVIQKQKKLSHVKSTELIEVNKNLPRTEIPHLTTLRQLKESLYIQRSNKTIQNSNSNKNIKLLSVHSIQSQKLQNNLANNQNLLLKCRQNNQNFEHLNNKKQIFQNGTKKIRNNSNLKQKKYSLQYQPQQRILDDINDQLETPNFKNRKRVSIELNPGINQQLYQQVPAFLKNKRAETIPQLTYSYISKSASGRFNFQTNHNAYFILPNVFNSSNKESTENINLQQQNQRNTYLFGLCDGHGRYGYLIANFLKMLLPDQVLANYEREQRKNNNNYSLNREPLLANSIKKCIRELQNNNKIDMKTSGTSISMVLYEEKKLYIANVGVSKIYMISKHPSSPWKIKRLSVDHSLQNPRQLQRISKKLNRSINKDQFKFETQMIDPHKNLPKKYTLDMTRSIGDISLSHLGIIDQPDISTYEISEQDKILIIGSQGLFQHVKEEDILKYAAKTYEAKRPVQQVALKLEEMAFQAQNKIFKSEDVTIILVFFNTI